ncbi:MAG TPA: hypothetical protein VGO86_14530, partial [Candidatus Dormibacteraeota bacterium]
MVLPDVSFAETQGSYAKGRVQFLRRSTRLRSAGRARPPAEPAPCRLSAVAGWSGPSTRSLDGLLSGFPVAGLTTRSARRTIQLLAPANLLCLQRYCGDLANFPIRKRQVQLTAPVACLCMIRTCCAEPV